ncbi:MAG: BlaI/MecI/CopY family transcriptional regulator [Planctomycetes bacterium]|nr:BlaI/MecI/CopY family transcriptional regulator [Planctomycetota bacterium]
MPTPPISDAEWYVLQAVWGGHPASAEDVVARLEGKADWSPRTVKTMLHRLVRKGALAYKKDGKRYLYSPAVSRRESVRRAIRDFLDRVFGGAAAPAIVHIVEESRLSREELERLKALVEDKLEK